MRKIDFCQITIFAQQVKTFSARLTTQKLTNQVLTRRGTESNYQANLPKTGDTAFVVTFTGALSLTTALGLRKKRHNG